MWAADEHNGYHGDTMWPRGGISLEPDSWNDHLSDALGTLRHCSV